MADQPTKNAPIAGGCLTAGAIVAGTVIGTIFRQPTIGVLVGGVVGILIALAIWAWDRRR